MKKTILLIALAATLPAIHTFAQPNGDRPPGGNQGGEHHMIPPIIKALDANGDGVIDAEEIANASKALLSLDKNGDGKLTLDEIRPKRPEGQNGQQGGGRPDGQNGDRPRRPRAGGGGGGGQGFDRPPRQNGGPDQDRGPRPQGVPQGSNGPRLLSPLMKALDANGDGVIDEKELANAVAALKALDKNGDGKITLEELRPQRPEGVQRPDLGKKPDGEKKPDGKKNSVPSDYDKK